MKTVPDLIVEKCVPVTRRPKLVTYLNPYSYVIARHHLPLFSRFDEIRIDGIALVFFLRLFGIVNVRRRSFDMSSDAPALFDGMVSEGKTVYFIGSKAEDIEKAVEKIKEAFPGLSVAGSRHGYFTDGEERRRMIDALVALDPDCVVCGMGTPKQEAFLLDLRAAGWRGDGYTCGGFLHQSAQRLQYYPRWMDRLHLRWLYRIYKEPGMLGRYAWEYPKFVLLYVRDVLRRKNAAGGPSRNDSPDDNRHSMIKYTKPTKKGEK